jgi:hypothetical protein
MNSGHSYHSYLVFAKGGEEEMLTMSSICKEFVATKLRSQINTLSVVLTSLEKAAPQDEEYTQESLRKVETELKQIRKLCSCS